MLDPTSWISNEPNQVQVNQQKHRNWTIGVIVVIVSLTMHIPTWLGEFSLTLRA